MFYGSECECLGECSMSAWEECVFCCFWIEYSFYDSFLFSLLAYYFYFFHGFDHFFSGCSRSYYFMHNVKSLNSKSNSSLIFFVLLLSYICFYSYISLPDTIIIFHVHKQFSVRPIKSRGMTLETAEQEVLHSYPFSATIIWQQYKYKSASVGVLGSRWDYESPGKPMTSECCFKNAGWHTDVDSLT